MLCSGSVKESKLGSGFMVCIRIIIGLMVELGYDRLGWVRLICGRLRLFKIVEGLVYMRL